MAYTPCTCTADYTGRRACPLHDGIGPGLKHLTPPGAGDITKASRPYDLPVDTKNIVPDYQRGFAEGRVRGFNEAITLMNRMAGAK